jgi:dienelactone hydrolase
VAGVIVFHHAQGLTSGVEEFAARLRAAGHQVETPDLYAGQTFATLDEGVAYAEQTGFDTITERGVAAVVGKPASVVYAGFSLGVLPAQLLAQTRPGALGALLLHSCVPPETFGEPWPDSVPAQIHAMDADKIFVEEGDLDAARGLATAAADVELFLYPGDTHLFADSSLPGYDAAATELLLERVQAFLAALG